MKAKKPPIIQYVCLAIMFAIASAYQARATIYSFSYYLHIQAVGWPFFPNYSHGQPHVAFVGSAAQQAGVKENDILVSVNGRPVTGLAERHDELAVDNLRVATEHIREHSPKLRNIPAPFLKREERSVHDVFGAELERPEKRLIG